MQIYLYDEKTTLYIGAQAATPDDVPGSYNFPLNALIDAPLTDEPGRWKAQGFTWIAVSPEELLQIKQAAITEAVQYRLDAFAQTKNYDNIFTAATYATSTNFAFAKEGQYAVEARDLTWAACYQILNDVMAGIRPEPTLEEILSELPVLTWPEV